MRSTVQFSKISGAIWIAGLLLTMSAGTFATDTTLVCSVVSSGAVKSSNAGYALQATIGQTVVGYSDVSGYMLEEGFWSIKWATGPCCVGIRGNVNGDHSEAITIGDISSLIDYVNLGGSEPSCPEEANVDGDGDGNIDQDDIDYLIALLYSSGPEPPACE